ncbi:hypothetical protein ACM01_05080 [Streptomyces viridochromogenes]|uniref:Uncharacterized protein n=1 Tax=Streptomyces viridochromogenes TaxID=1938 RepID=A0A0J7ZME3_STRVR|nr:hypothetical protein ACM01_05080 [Streptomyces viridochromogenes]KOG23330.1 hypothetical protein ADK35_13740 [Streptomyces viridochromogenes]KOG27064.1 hypothetical protein ADK36_00325 [Streptomyces viridochromogenes]
MAGTLQNDTGYTFYGADLEGGSNRCRVWNKGGDSTIAYKTFDCAKYKVAPHTTTGYWKDVDAINPGGGQPQYRVRFGYGPDWTWVWQGTYTKIRNWHRAICSASANGLVSCTVVQTVYQP